MITTGESVARVPSRTRCLLPDVGGNDLSPASMALIIAFWPLRDASQYPIEVLDTAQNGAFTGAAWHCYGGNPSGQRPFNDAYPNKEVWFTECTRIS